MVHILSKCLMAGIQLLAFLPLLCSVCSEGLQRRCHKSKQNPIQAHPSSFTQLTSPHPKYIIITSVPGLPYTAYRNSSCMMFSFGWLVFLYIYIYKADQRSFKKIMAGTCCSYKKKKKCKIIYGK